MTVIQPPAKNRPKECVRHHISERHAQGAIGQCFRCKRWVKCTSHRFSGGCRMRLVRPWHSRDRRIINRYLAERDAAAAKEAGDR